MANEYLQNGSPNRVNSTSFSREYLRLVQQMRSGLSGDYARLAQFDPAQAYNYNLGLWDHIGNFFGFNTNEDRLRLETEQNSLQYMQQLALKQQQENYDSAQSQAERLRLAGQNPDLAGVSAGESSGITSDETPTDYSTVGNPSETIQNVISAIDTAAGIAGKIVGFEDAIQGLRGRKLGNDNAEVRNFADAIGLADALAGFQRGDYDPNVIMDRNGDISTVVPGSYGELNGSRKIGGYVMSRSLGQRLAPIFNQVYHSRKSRAGNVETANALVNSLYEQGVNSNLSYKGGPDDAPDIWSKLTKDITKLIEIDTRWSLRSSGAQNQYNAGFYGEADPLRAAAAANEGHDFEAQDKRTLKELNSVRSRIIHTLSDDAQDSSSKTHVLSAIGLMLLYGMNSGAASSAIGTGVDVSKAASMAKTAAAAAMKVGL